MVAAPSGDALVSAVAAFLVVALATVSVVLVGEFVKERRRKHAVIEQLHRLADDVTKGEARPPAVLRPGERHASWLAAVAGRLPHLRDLALLLQQSGLPWSLQTFLLLSGGLGLAGAAAALFATGLLGSGPIGAAIGLALPYLLVRRRRTGRLQAFEEALPESIDLIGRALRAGHPLSAGFKMAADEGAEPVASELRRVFEEQRFGLPLEESLLGLADRVNLMDVRFLVTAILIQREVGGNLAEILDNLAAVIRARFTIRRQLRVYTAQGRMTGYLLAVLPIVLFVVLYALNPDYMAILFKDPTGRAVTAIAVLLQIVGFLWIRRIINIEI